MKEFTFSRGGYFDGSYYCDLLEGKLEIEFGDRRSRIYKRGVIDVPIDFDNRIISIVKNWKKKYVDANVRDGTKWGLIAIFDDGTKIESDGDNKYPENFKELENYLNSLADNNISYIDEKNSEEIVDIYVRK